MAKAEAGGFVTAATVVSGYTFDARGNLVPPGRGGGNPAAGSNARLLTGKKEAAERAAEDYDAVNDELERYLANLEAERELAALSGSELEVQRALREANAAAVKDGNLLSDEARARIRAEVEATHDLSEAQRQLEQQARAAAETQRELANAFRDGLTDIALDFDNATDAARRFFEEIASQVLKRQVTGPLADSLGGALDGSGLLGGIGDLFGGFFAGGGRPPVGKASVVGEAGPELFVPDAAGTVVPNHALGGRGHAVSVVFNMSPGLPGTVQAELMAMLPAIEARTKAAVFGAIERGGSESRMVGRRG